MLGRLGSALLFLLFLPHGCTQQESQQVLQLRRSVAGTTPQILALYEPWFGHPRHISIGYSSHDPAVISNQIHQAAAMGISAFVVDWYGDREPFNDASFALMQTIAAKQNFHVAIIYDETNQEDGATDETIADFNMYHDTYLSPKA